MMKFEKENESKNKIVVKIVTSETKSRKKIPEVDKKDGKMTLAR